MPSEAPRYPKLRVTGTSAARHARETVRQVAAQAGMSHATYTASKIVAANAEPELCAAVDAGRIGVSTGAKLARMSPDLQRQAVVGGRRVAAAIVREHSGDAGGTLALATALERTVNRFVAAHPSTTPGEILAALRFVAGEVAEQTDDSDRRG